MDADDFVEPEIGAAVALTALVCSPTLRKSLRKGLVYGLAGGLSVVDKLRSLTAAKKEVPNA